MTVEAVSRLAQHMAEPVRKLARSFTPPAVQQEATPSPSPGPSPTPTPTPTPGPSHSPTPTPKPPGTDPQAPSTPEPSAKPGPAPIAPMSTQAEKAADAKARAALQNDPAALAEYEELLKSDGFQRHDGGYPGDGPGVHAQTRISMMTQIAARPEARVIENLEQMSKRGWFNDMSREDKQRAIKIVAYASSDKTAGASGNTTRRNTIDAMVRNDDPPLKFADLRNDNTGVTWGQRSSNPFGSDIALNRKLIAADDNPIQDGTNESRLAVNTLAHEYNHELRDGPNEASHDYYMNEYRAWYAGFVSENGRPPTRQEAFDRSRELLMTDLYPNLRDAFDGKDHLLDGNDAGEEQAKIVRFLAGMAGLDPQTATADDIRQLSRSQVPAGDAPLPVSTSSDDPNNIDNHKP